jgi:hypothetical protein
LFVVILRFFFSFGIKVFAFYSIPESAFKVGALESVAGVAEWIVVSWIVSQDWVSFEGDSVTNNLRLNLGEMSIERIRAERVASKELTRIFVPGA